MVSEVDVATALGVCCLGCNGRYIASVGVEYVWAKDGGYGGMALVDLALVLTFVSSGMSYLSVVVVILLLFWCLLSSVFPFLSSFDGLGGILFYVGVGNELRYHLI